MGELSETTLKKKVKQTINKCVKNKQLKKIMDQVQKKSKTKIDFWQNIIKPKYNKMIWEAQPVHHDSTSNTPAHLSFPKNRKITENRKIETETSLKNQGF